MARLEPKPYPLRIKWGSRCDYREVIQYEDSVWDELQSRSQALPPGEIVGAVLTFPVADGRAVYLVTKAKPLTLQHVPLGDGYRIPEAHVRGITKSDVLRAIEGDRWMATVFAKKEGA